MLSPRDWALASDWYVRQVPLAAVLEALEEAAERARKRGRAAGPRSLAYVASAVEENWELIRRGRAGQHSAASSSLPPLASTRESWRQAEKSATEDPSLGALLSKLLLELAAGKPPADVDRELDERLLACAPPALVARSQEKVSSELEPFRARMSEKTFEVTRRRAVVERLRRALNLPRLALSDPTG